MIGQAWEGVGGVYSRAVLDHFHAPRNVGELPAPDAVGTAGEPGRGNYMVLHLNLHQDHIVACGFLTFGCASAIAAGSCLTETIKGKPVAEALQLTPEALETALGGLPLGKRHCAALAIQALHAALTNSEDPPAGE